MNHKKVTVDVELFPGLLKSPFIRERFNIWKFEEEKIKRQEHYLAIIIESFQNSCPHEKFKNNKTRDVVISKTCECCGFTKYKPEGSHNEICINCWSPMKFLKSTDGPQPQRKNNYKCPLCHTEACE